MNPLLVQDGLEHNAIHRAQKTALVCGSTRLTYAELDALANRCGQALKSLGVQRGDRVALCLPNSVEAVVAIFGALKAGAAFVPIHPSTKREKLAYIINNCRARALFIAARTDLDDWTGSGTAATAPSLAAVIRCGYAPGADAGKPAEAAGRMLELDPWLAAHASETPARDLIDRDLACLIYTSGSTGEPKGVISDHSNVVFAASSIISYLGNVESDIVLNVLPLSFDYGLYQLLMTTLFGGTLVLERNFTFPAAALKLMEREGVTGFPGVPTIFTMLLDMDLSTFDLSRLRYVTNTAAALAPSQVEAIRKKFAGAQLFSMYGLTETKRTLYLPPAELAARPGSVGIPIPGTEAWIEGEDGRRLLAGEIGELVARGRHVMRGYWDSPDLSEQRFRPGPLPGERVCHTGDLFRQDAGGFFYFVGRMDDIIKSRGEKVAPKEVENVLYAMPEVLEAAVIGVPDELLGQAIKAYVVPRDPGLTPQAVLAHCRRNLEDLMVPKYIEFRPSLPKSTSGKIQKQALPAIA